jgi:hypothetical protein
VKAAENRLGKQWPNGNAEVTARRGMLGEETLAEAEQIAAVVRGSMRQMSLRMIL